MIKLGICEKFKKLHLEERVICIFSILISIILILNVIVDVIHLINYNVNKNNMTSKITVIEDRLDGVEKNLEEFSI